MFHFSHKHKLIAFISMFFLISVACVGSSGGGNSGDTVDLDATAEVLQMTADAISANQADSNNPPSDSNNPPADNPPPDNPPPSNDNNGDSTCEDTAANYSSGDIVLSTEFDSADCWGTFQIPGPDNPDNSDYDVSLYNSSMFFEIYDGGISAYATYDPILDFTDVLVGAGVNTVSGPNTNNISLVCRGTDVGWYEFSMTSGGEWIIWKVDATKTTINDMYEALASGFSDHYLKHLYNEIGISCVGDTLSFYITQRNGDVKLVGQVQDRTYRNGQVAIAVYSYPTSSVGWNYNQEAMGVEFDWLEIQIP
jgi:hypothetical protein